MFRKVLTLVLLGVGIALSAKLEFTIQTHAKIENLKQQAQVLSDENPSNAPVCFAYYKPLLTNISDQYETNYGLCASNYENGTEEINAEWQSSIDDIVNSASNECGTAISSCECIVDIVAMLQCYSEATASESKAMYQVSNNATQTAQAVQKEIGNLGTAQSLCISNAEKSYVEDTASTYEGLNACLDGQTTTVPTSTINTSSTSTTVPDSEAGDPDSETTEA